MSLESLTFVPPTFVGGIFIPKFCYRATTEALFRCSRSSKSRLDLLARPELGITEWVDELYRVPLYAILSGFEPGDVPGIGTFYDFFPCL